MNQNQHSRERQTQPPKKTVVIDLEYLRPCVDNIRTNSDSDGSNGSDNSNNSDDTLSDGSDNNSNNNAQFSPSPPPPPVSKSKCDSPDDNCYAVDSDEDLLQSVIDEPTFPLDVNAILQAMNKNENSTIANMTFKKIAERRLEILSNLDLETVKFEEFSRKLALYRVIETPQELRQGQLVRWIPLKSLPKPYLTLGGTIFGIRQNLEDRLHQVTIRHVKGLVFQIKFEVNVVFQRLSKDEMLILRAVEYVSDV